MDRGCVKQARYIGSDNLLPVATNLTRTVERCKERVYGRFPLLIVNQSTIHRSSLLVFQIIPSKFFSNTTKIVSSLELIFLM